MKRISLLVVLTLLSSLAFSQGFRNMSPEERAKRDTEQLKDQLGLTENQTESAYKINLKNAEEMQKVFSTSTGDREAMRESMQELRLKRDSSYQEILTDYQFDQYKKIMEERMERRRQRFQEGDNQ